MKTILVVTSDKELLQTVEAALALENHRILAAGCTADALHLLADAPAELILVDLRLSLAEELLAMIRGLPGRETVPMIAISDQVAPEVRRRAADCGVVDFFPDIIPAMREFHRAVRRCLG